MIQEKTQGKDHLPDQSEQAERFPFVFSKSALLRSSGFGMMGLLLLVCYSGISQTASLSLSDAIEIGLKNNYQIQIRQLEKEQAANLNDWGVAGKYPSINLSLSNNNTYSGSSNPASFLREIASFGTGLGPGVEANWVLFDGYRVRFTKQQLEQQEQRGEIALKLAVENTVQSIIQAYYAALVQKEQLDVRMEVLALSRDRVEYQEIRKEYGQAGTFDVLQTQDAYLNDSTSYIVQLNTYENALRSLNLAMGIDAFGTQYTLTDTLSRDLPSYELNAIQTRMLANNQSILNLQMARELAHTNTLLQESTKSPTISLRAGANYNLNKTVFGTGTFADGSDRDLGGIGSSNYSTFINLNATYNIFDSGVRRKQVENAKTGELIAQLNIEEAKRSLNLQLENGLATFESQRELVRVTQQLVDNASRNLEIAEERFRGGLINSFDYRTIQLGYINANQSLLNAIYNMKLTETELIRLTGGLVR
ncbi:MAG: TolC family protein [Lewinella sp.]|nr:TolC family protein [Lewinella sp.]